MGISRNIISSLVEFSRFSTAINAVYGLRILNLSDSLIICCWIVSFSASEEYFECSNSRINALAANRAIVPLSVTFALRSILA